MIDESAAVVATPLGQELQPYLRRFAAPPAMLIIGNYGRGNLGDEAILAGILADVGALARPIVLSREPTAVADRDGMQAVQSLSLHAARAVRRADVIAIGGGGIFGNGMTLLPKLLPIIALLLQLMGKQVVFVAIGAYATAPRWVSWLLRRVARRSPLVTVRDPESAATLGSGSILVRDPGLDLPPSPAHEAERILAHAGVDVDVPLLGLSVKPSMHDDCNVRQRELLLQVINFWLGKSPGEVAILAMSARGDFGLGDTSTDATIAADLAASCIAPQRVKVIGPTMHPSLMKAIIGRCDLMVAHRLHAQIFAHAMGVAVVGLSYERKADEFLAMVGAARVDLAQPHDADGQILLDQCREVLRRAA